MTVLLDLGLSSPQIDDPARGFSWKSNGPLDMRLNPARGQTAAELLQKLTPAKLAALLPQGAQLLDIATGSGAVVRALRALRPDLAVSVAFLELMQSKGEAVPDEAVLEDAVAFAGVSKYPARIKCALLGWMAWKDAVAQAVSRHETPEVPS